MDYREKLKDRINQILKERDMTQTQAAKMLSISQQAFNEKTNKGSWRFVDAEYFFNLAGYDLIIQDRKKT